MARSTTTATCMSRLTAGLVAHVLGYVGNLRDEQWIAFPSAKPEVALS